MGSVVVYYCIPRCLAGQTRSLRAETAILVEGRHLRVRPKVGFTGLRCELHWTGEEEWQSISR